MKREEAVVQTAAAVVVELLERGFRDDPNRYHTGNLRSNCIRQIECNMNSNRVPASSHSTEMAKLTLDRTIEVARSRKRISAINCVMFKAGDTRQCQ